MSKRSCISPTIWVLVLVGAADASIPRMARGQAPEPPVSITVDASWKLVAEKASPAALELFVTSGKITEVILLDEVTGDLLGKAQPPSPARQAKSPDVWSLRPARSGRIRARLEAPLGAILVMRSGAARGQLVLGALLDGPKTAEPESPLQFTAERTSWDAIEVDASDEAFRGFALAGEAVPLGFGLNVLSPVPTEVDARLSARLLPIRGGPALWTDEFRGRVPTNPSTTEKPTWRVEVRTPEWEGTYLLEVEAAWEPAVPENEGTRLSRLLKRWRASNSQRTCVRRMTIAVVRRQADQTEPPRSGKFVWPEGELADAIDTAATRGRWARSIATGRSPLESDGSEAWPVPRQVFGGDHKRERLKGLLGRGGSEAGILGGKDEQGPAWMAMPVHLSQPGVLHRLTVTIDAGDPQALGLLVTAQPREGRRERVFLDAGASGPPILPNGPAVSFTRPFWADATEATCVIVNRGAAPVRVARIEVVAVGETPVTSNPFAQPGDDRRALGIRIARADLDRFAAGIEPFPRLRDAYGAGKRLHQYLSMCGASLVILPESLSDRSLRRALSGQADEDALGPDGLAAAEASTTGRGIRRWIELDDFSALPGLPAAGSREAAAAGLVQLDARGTPAGAAYQPLNPQVQAAIAKKIDALFETGATRAPSGILIRLGEDATIPGGALSGFDDRTFGDFVAATFSGETAKHIPGLDNRNPGRFDERRKFLSGAGRTPWLIWRSQRLGAFYRDLQKHLEAKHPGAVLSLVTPGLESGVAGLEAKNADRRGISPARAWSAVGLGFEHWSLRESSLQLLRGAGSSARGTEREFAVNRDLDQAASAARRRGVVIGLGGTSDRKPASGAGSGSNPAATLEQTALPGEPGPAENELPGHAIAALDADTVIFSFSEALGREDSLRGFARVLESLPPANREPAPPKEIGVAVRVLEGKDHGFIELANDAPYAMRIELVVDMPPATRVEDLGRELQLLHGPASAKGPASARKLVLDLAPYGVTALRLNRHDARIVAADSKPAPEVEVEVRAKARELADRLVKLTRRSVSAKPREGAEGALLAIPAGASESFESDRGHARRVLVAALQAYRDQRLADFARLANSRWANIDFDEAGDADAELRTGAASDLPGERRVR